VSGYIHICQCLVTYIYVCVWLHTYMSTYMFVYSLSHTHTLPHTHTIHTTSTHTQPLDGVGPDAAPPTRKARRCRASRRRRWGSAPFFRKRPVHMSRETCTHVKRDLYTCQKRPVHMSKETITPIKRKQRHESKEPWTHVTENLQKRPVHLSKETCKRDLLTNQTLFVVAEPRMPKETYTHVKRGLYTCQKRPTKETYWQSRRYLSLQSHVCRKRPIHMSKGTCTHVKRDLHRGPTDNLGVICRRRASRRRRWGKSQMSKETCTLVKRDLQKRPIDNLR